jgi:HSP20 family protein
MLYAAGKQEIFNISPTIFICNLNIGSLKFGQIKKFTKDFLGGLIMYRRYRTPSIWREMDRLQQDMNRLIGDLSVNRMRRAPSYPAINVWAADDSALITAEIPGLNKDDLEINVTGDTLTLSGVRKSDDLPEGVRYHRRERTFGEFNRSIQLPYTVDVNKVKATFKNGVLKVELPRIEAEKPKKITVKAS